MEGGGINTQQETFCKSANEVIIMFHFLQLINKKQERGGDIVNYNGTQHNFIVWLKKLGTFKTLCLILE